MKIKIIKKQQGITLIALVITIIVLLILAGVSIAMLTGENGILTKASSASEQTKQQGALEKVKLAVAGSWGNDGKISIEELKSNLNNVEGIDKSTIKDSLPMLVKVDGIDVNIEINGRVNISNSDEIGSLPSTDNTKPYLPSGDFTQVEGTTLDNGLTIKDSNGNRYVWVEVPKTIYTTATSNTDYSNIEADMQTYVVNYKSDICTDKWYEGCGLTEIEYNNLKQTMLKSVYDNGGFWISQYEIGTDTIRAQVTNDLSVAMSKEGLYPYNNISISQAQTLAKGMNSGNYNSSLLFGIQWNLVLKYIEVKANMPQEQINSDSTQWGNYRNSTFNVLKGKCSTDNGTTYSEVGDNYTKPASEVLLTTGTAQRNSVLNIYDIAGNVFEWTLEQSSDSEGPATTRGGAYVGTGANPASIIVNVEPELGGFYSIGFRTALY